MGSIISRASVITPHERLSRPMLLRWEARQQRRKAPQWFQTKESVSFARLTSLTLNRIWDSAAAAASLRDTLIECLGVR